LASRLIRNPEPVEGGVACSASLSRGNTSRDCIPLLSFLDQITDQLYRSSGRSSAPKVKGRKLANTRRFLRGCNVKQSSLNGHSQGNCSVSCLSSSACSCTVCDSYSGRVLDEGRRRHGRWISVWQNCTNYAPVRIGIVRENTIQTYSTLTRPFPCRTQRLSHFPNSLRTFTK